MVDLTPFRHFHEFSRRIHALRTAYDTAHQAGEASAESARDELLGHLDRLEFEGASDDATDSLGNYVSKRLLLEIDYYAINASQVALRKSVTSALYHLWERSVLRWVVWTGRKHANHADLVGMATVTGASPYNLSKLEPLHFINNALKHDNPSWIERLRDGDYDRYLEDRTLSPLDSPWGPYETIHLTHSDVIEFFDLIADCGPNPLQAWPGMLPTRQEFTQVFE